MAENPVLKEARRKGLTTTTTTKKKEEAQETAPASRYTNPVLREYFGEKAKERAASQQQIISQAREPQTAPPAPTYTATPDYQKRMSQLQEQRRQAQVDLDTDAVNRLDAEISTLRASTGMSQLEERRRLAQVDMDIEAVNRLDEEMKNLRASLGEQTAADRWSDILSGSSNTGWGQTVNAVGTLAAGVDHNERQIARLQEVLRTGYTSDGKPINDAQRKGIEESIARMQAENAEVQNDPNHAGNRLQQTADIMTGTGDKQIESAKKGLGSAGQFFVDVGVGGLQLAGDVAASALVPGAGTALMATRAFGGSAQEARHAGATRDQQLLYGAGSAATSILTEKLGNVGGAFKTAFGAGILDKALAKVTAKPFGKLIAGAISEGGEEFIEALAQPLLQKLTYNPDAAYDEEWLSEALYSAAIGAVLGGAGTAISPSTYIADRTSVPESRNAATETGAGAQEQTFEGKFTPQSENAAEGLKTATTGVSHKRLDDVLYKKRDEVGDWGGASGSTTELVYENLAKVNPELAAIIDAEMARVKGPMPVLSAMIAVSEDVRQSTVSPAGAIQFLSDTYNAGGKSALVALYNPKTGNLWDESLSAMKTVDMEQRAIQSAYEAGKANLPRERANFATEAQEEAYMAGQRDRIANTSDAELSIENQKAAAYTGINETEVINNGTERVHLREGVQRYDGADSQRPVRQLEKGAGRNQGRSVQSRPADGEAANISYGKKVSTAELGIEGGSKTDGVFLVDSNATASTRAAQKVADERGLKLVLFAGHDLHMDEAPDGARGYYDGKTIYARVDDPDFTAEQIALHESGHDMIAKGEIDLDAVRDRIGDSETAAKLYEMLYAGTNMTADDIWEECVCDSLGNMNIFTSTDTEAERFMDNFMNEARQTVESSRQAPRGPPVESDGKASRRTLIGDVFPPYNESQSDANERATRWAHREDIKTGDKRLFSYNGRWYLVEAFDSADLGYRIIESLTEKQYSAYIKEANDYDGQEQSVQERLDRARQRNRKRKRAGRGEQGSNSSLAEQRRENRDIYRNAGAENGPRETAGDGSRNLQSSSAGGKRSLNELSAELKALEKQLQKRGLAREQKTEIRKEIRALRKEFEERMPRYGKASRRLSPEAIKADSDYMKAVSIGDMETAQKMVDEAAKAAGYKDVVYHGTDADFTKFRRGELGIHVGTIEQATARNDKRVLKLYAKLGKSFEIYRDYGDWHGKNTAQMLLETEEVEALARYDDSKYEEIENKLSEISAMPDGEKTDTVLREYLHSLGWDSITYENRFEGVDAYYYDSAVDHDNWSHIIFDPEDVKSADPVTYDDTGNVIPLSERFKPENNDIRYSRRLDRSKLAPMFYSKMERVVSDVKQEKLGASSVVSMLRGKGVKAEEIKWSGIETFLEGKKSVTKQELLEFIRGSQMQIEEETLDNKALDYTEEQSAKIAEYTEKHHAIMDNLAAEWKRIVGTEFPLNRAANVNGDNIDAELRNHAVTIADNTPEGERFAELRSEIREMISDNGDFGFDRMAQAYRSILWNPESFIRNYDVSADEASLIREFAEAKRAVEEARSASAISEQDAQKLKSLADEARDWMRKVSDVKSEYYAEQSKRMTKWGQYKLDGGKNYREYLFKMPGSDYSNQAMAGHWGERTGVLAHARVQDFEHEGQPVLFVEEIQSDWHNAGAKDGYRASLRDAELVDRGWHYALKVGGNEFNNILSKARLDELYESDNYTLSELNHSTKEAFAKEFLFGQFSILDKRTPDAPYAKTYHEFVLKNLLRKAAEGDYDYLAWTPGNMQEERWSSEYAEGYRIEYDQDIPKFLNKYGKQWGAAVEKIALDGTGAETKYYDTGWGEEYDSLDEWKEAVFTELREQDIPDSDISNVQFVERAGHTAGNRYIVAKDPESGRVYAEAKIKEPSNLVWAIPVTDAMKQSVLYEGQPRYSRRIDSEELAKEIDRIIEEGRKAGRSNEDIRADVRAAVDEVYQGMIEEYGAIDPGENPARNVHVPKKTATDKKVSQTVRTILEAGVTPDEALPDIERLVATGDFSYDVYTDKAAIADATNKIKHVGWAQALADWTAKMKKGEVSKENTATGWALYNNAVNSGDVKTAMTVLDYMVKHQRNAAQALQATRILKKLSPETQLYQVQRSVESLQEELNDRFGEKNAPELKVDPDLAEQYMKAKDQDERDEVMKDIYRDIGRQMPSTFRDKWNAWRYLAMLGNPRTHVRNIFGNAIFAPVVAAKNLTATGIEGVVSRVSGGKLDRTKSVVGFSKADKALLKAAWDDFSKVQDAAMSGGKYNDFANANQYIEEGKQVFKSKLLEAARKGNSKALDAEDMWFSQPHYAFALASYCKQHGLTPEQITKGKETKNARAYAIKEAQKATYRDTNALSQTISELGRVRADEKNPVKKGVGLVMEGILPFRKTPANILARGVEYSPIGLMSGIKQAVFDVKRGKKTGAEAIDSISSGLTGTGLLALGLYMAAQGLIRGHGDDEEKENEFKELMGHQAYALELPDGTSVTLDWLAPECLPFFVGVNLWEQTEGEKENLTFSTMLNSVKTVSEPMLELSCLQSLNDVFDSVGYATSEGLDGLPAALATAVTSYLTQALPTILGQAERTGEDTRMTTYTEKNAFLTGDMQYTLGRASARIPGIWDYQQIPYIDAWGRTESTGSAGERAFNNFLNPAYTSRIETSAMEDELLRLFEETGEGSVLPSRAAKYFTVDGERKDLTAEEYVKYAQKKGKDSYSLLTKLTGNKQYGNMNAEQRVKAVEDVYDYANQIAKASISGYKVEAWVKKAQEAEKKYGISPDAYICLKTKTADIESLKDKEGETIDNSKGLLIMQTVYNTPGLTEKQRQAMFEYLGVGKKVRHYNKALVEKELAKMRKK